MNCRLAKRWIHAGSEAAPSTAQRVELAAHLAECPGCRRLEAALSEAMAAWRAQAAAMPEPNTERAWSALRRSIRQTQPERRRASPWWAFASLGAAAALGIGLWIAPGGDPAPESQRAIARATEPTQAESTVVYVDDRSGWTFVWSADPGRGDQRI